MFQDHSSFGLLINSKRSSLCIEVACVFLLENLEPKTPISVHFLLLTLK